MPGSFASPFDVMVFGLFSFSHEGLWLWQSLPDGAHWLGKLAVYYLVWRIAWLWLVFIAACIAWRLPQIRERVAGWSRVMCFAGIVFACALLFADQWMVEPARHLMQSALAEYGAEEGFVAEHSLFVEDQLWSALRYLYGFSLFEYLKITLVGTLVFLLFFYSGCVVFLYDFFRLLRWLGASISRYIHFLLSHFK